jgi:hypothetical protein
MLLVVTSASDPELFLFQARPGVALVVPAHMSQPGWSYEVGRGADAKLVTSKGLIAAGDIGGVLTRTQRAWPTDLVHIHPQDREYVAAEMTAFLAALLSELACPLFNRPAANSWWGPPWSAEHWRRAAAKEGIPICCDHDDCCADTGCAVVVGDRVTARDETLSHYAKTCALRLSELADVCLLEARFCGKHQGLQQVSMRPALDEELLGRIEQFATVSRERS